jgi:iron complex outermembrane receptor protein
MKLAEIAMTSALCSALFLSAARAQSTSDGSDNSTATDQTASAGLQEIVVTAQRRAQSIHDIGIAISAYSADALADKGISSSTELGLITPGVFVSGSAGGESSQFSIRGVTQSDFNDAIEAPVAVYTDETYIPSQQGQTLAAFDLDRVEILKGPQGTLFGRNATGGLVQFVVKKPTDVLSADMNAEYGRFNLIKFDGGVGGPIADGVSFRISGLYQTHDDILTNLAPTGGLAAGSPTSVSGNLNPCCHNTWNDDSQAIRAQLKLTPTDKLTIRLSGTYDQQKLDGAPTVERPTIATVDAQGRIIQSDFASPTETRIAINPAGGNVGNSEPATFVFGPASGVRVPGSDFFGFDGRKVGDLQTSLDYTGNGINAFSDYDAALHVDYDFGGVALASISDYKLNKKQLFVDLEASPVNVGAFQTRARDESFAQEIRLSGNTEHLRWTAGTYFLGINATSTRGLGAPSGSFLAAAFGLLGPGVDLSDNISLHTRSVSLFSQGEYDFAPGWTFVLGGRGILEKQKYDFASVAAANSSDFHVDGAPALFTLQPSFNDNRTEHMWAGKAQLEYRPDKDVLLYFGVNRGVKAGSYNALILPPMLAPDQIPYRPEVLLTFEPGFKVNALNHRLTVNGSVFYYDYKDYQAFTFEAAGGYVQNRDARNYGIDLEIIGRPTDSLTATIAASVMHATVKDVAIAPDVLRDVRPTYAPNQQVSASLEYMLPRELFGGHLSVLLDGNYTSDFYNNITNFNSTRAAGYVLADGGVSWRGATGKWRVAGRVANMFDKRYFGVGFDQTNLVGGTQMQLGDPRWWKLSVGFNF